jgi:hypothetical protein
VNTRQAVSDLLERSQKLTVKRMSQFALVVTLVGSASFGGLREVEEPGPSTLAPDERHVGAQLAVEVHRVITVDSLPPIPDPGDGERIVAVVATVENLSDRTITGGLADTFLLDDVSGVENTEPASYVGLVRDGTGFPHIQPGVPDRLVFAWNAAAEAVPASVTVVVREKTLVNDPLTLHGPTWLFPSPAAIVEVPVEDLDEETDG